jgi:hypothetical protein
MRPTAIPAAATTHRRVGPLRTASAFLVLIIFVLPKFPVELRGVTSRDEDTSKAIVGKAVCPRRVESVQGEAGRGRRETQLRDVKKHYKVEVYIDRIFI